MEIKITPNVAKKNVDWIPDSSNKITFELNWIGFKELIQ